MYTAAEIRNVEFTKNMGGYKAAEVDAFVDNCADTVEKLTAEKEELNKKLSILADKLVEYRRDEDSIRSALLSAQRMGDSIVREAKEQAEEIVAGARVQADEIVGSAKKDIAAYEDILARAKNDVSEFKAALLTLYKDHLAMLKNIPDVDDDVKVASEVQTVVAPVEDVVVAPQAEVVVEVPVEEPVAAKSKFANLKFGDDYNLADDADE
ncbi:MAG: DivIVA domain-containing protein [Clostridia bacterium]|nr:DivIVA domain-containing protein [Clostridia bacterium]